MKCTKMDCRNDAIDGSFYCDRHRSSDELQKAMEIASRFLENSRHDPDGDECVLARQFNRLLERYARLLPAGNATEEERKKWSRDLADVIYGKDEA